MASFEKEIAQRLKNKGYKLTSQRLAVLAAIASGEGHMTPEAVHERVRQVQPGVGLVTVYRTLNMLVDLGLVCEVHVGDSCRSFVISPAEHHDHLVCSECGKVVDFAGCGLGSLESRLAHETGFAIDSHLLEFLGRCPSCRNG
ncbi:MAG: transcriptional repressor [Chloroflexi bacterium]|nr:transcriptional repressor [Chloroflexota bacterium]